MYNINHFSLWKWLYSFLIPKNNKITRNWLASKSIVSRDKRIIILISIHSSSLVLSNKLQKASLQRFSIRKKVSIDSSNYKLRRWWWWKSESTVKKGIEDENENDGNINNNNNGNFNHERGRHISQKYFRSRLDFYYFFPIF